MPEPMEPSRWIFRCQSCGYALLARSFLHLSPCPLCNGLLKNLGRDSTFPDKKEVKADEARAKKD